MPDYRYVAIDPQGRERKGRLTAANDDAARANLAAQLVLVSCDEAPVERIERTGIFPGAVHEISLSRREVREDYLRTAVEWVAGQAGS